MSPPVEPPPTPWAFPAPWAWGPDELVCAGADLAPGTLLAAYRNGLFPMPLGRRRELGWWSPDPRGILPLDGLRVSRSLRRSLRRYGITFDTAFGDVVDRCADRRRRGAWITPEIHAAYGELHRLGWAHSVEAWSDGELAGGLYGVCVGGLFAGESMFSSATDASKVCLVHLVGRLRAGGATLLDVQWQTPHLASLGVVETSRAGYLELLAEAVARPDSWGSG